MDFISCVSSSCVSRGPCYGPITRSEEVYCVYVYLIVGDQVQQKHTAPTMT
jgi:hypothetical protein